MRAAAAAETALERLALERDHWGTSAADHDTVRIRVGRMAVVRET